jgi:glycosyltransferase involved in cell wall biosynthesis
MSKREQVYVLVTPAKNEESFISQTIESVMSQTHPPARWVIVSDGSTDRTDEIVASYQRRHGFMRLLTRKAAGGRNAASKVMAFRSGVEALRDVDYDFLGNLDADISCPEDYFAGLMGKFADNPGLGLAGGVICHDVDGRRLVNCSNAAWSVSGAVQMFRRRCYDEIGGYLPIPVGGEDAAAEVMARMRGWEVHAFADLVVRGNRKVCMGRSSDIRIKFDLGGMDYSLGYHPLFEAGRCALRMQEPPYVIGSLARLAGFLWAGLKGCPMALPDDVTAYLRREQLGRMISIFSDRSARQEIMSLLSPGVNRAASTSGGKQDASCGRERLRDAGPAGPFPGPGRLPSTTGSVLTGFDDLEGIHVRKAYRGGFHFHWRAPGPAAGRRRAARR